MSGRQTTLSLPEVLARAHEVREVADPSPLVTVALHRLLLALLHRVFGPSDEPAWERLAQAGRFDAAALERYLAGVEPGFDLFDPQRPFYQAPGLPGHLAAPVRRLAPEQATGRQPSVWDHHQDHDSGAVSLARAACWLLAHHAFCLSGCLCDGKRLTGVPAGPLTHAAVFMPTGESLHETLLINLVACDPAAHAPLPVVGEDLPAWERPSPLSPGAPPSGYLDYLTWQTRRIQLLPSAAGGVSEVIVMPGRSFNLRSLAGDPLLVANPTFKRGKRRLAWLQPEDHLAWLERQGSRRGFSLTVVQAEAQGFSRSSHGFSCHGVRFDGVLVVTEPKAFVESVVRGIGSAKAFGYGLLSLAPA